MNYLKHWRGILLLVTPLIFLPLPLVYKDEASRCAYVILIMATFWATEVVNICVTALVPVFAFPLLGVLSTTEVCSVYMKDTNMLLFAGLAVAVAIEHSRLHQRLALEMLIRVGSTPERLLLGFMVTQMFLSMWIVNVAATAMMAPMVAVVLQSITETASLEDEGNAKIGSDNCRLEVGVSERSQDETTKPVGKLFLDEKKESDALVDVKKKENFVRDILYLGVAYSSNIGGTGTLTGANANLIFMGFLQSRYREVTEINYTSWLLYNIPGVLIATAIAYFYLRTLIAFHRKKYPNLAVFSTNDAVVKNVLQKQLNSLGKISYQEKTVGIMFLTMIGLWIFRKPEFITGWSYIFQEKFNTNIGAATPALFIVFLIFALPSKGLWCFSSKASSTASDGCLTWNVLLHRLQWGVILLVGSSFALAEASKKSGLSDWMGQQFIVMAGFPKEWTLLMICVATAVLTEIMSNVTVTSILIPIINEMSRSIEVNPIFFLLPMTLCSSYAFMLPVATVPNAIVFDAAGDMPISRMMIIGFFMNVICIVVAMVMMLTYGNALFGLSEFPQWANATATELLTATKM